MKEYIEREAATAKSFRVYMSNGQLSNQVVSVKGIKSIPAADVVPWEWLEQYARGMRMNFASDFVAEARKLYGE